MSQVLYVIHHYKQFSINYVYNDLIGIYSILQKKYSTFYY